MIETSVRPSEQSVEESLRADLARGDALAGTVQPILQHLLGSDNMALFGDEIVARVRGMLHHLAGMLLTAAQVEPDIAMLDLLCGALSESPGMLAHLHATALEWQLAERLEQRFGVDPVVPPLLQALIASPEPQTQELAMRLLAAQARWCQGQRRMQLSRTELPGELLHAALLALRSAHAGSEAADARIRATYDEGTTRLGMAARLVASMGSAAGVALDLRHGGGMLFATALASGSGQARDVALLATHEAQLARLAVSLRACGQSPAAVGQQILMLHPDATLPSGFERLSVERAAAILSEAHHAGR